MLFPFSIHCASCISSWCILLIKWISHYCCKHIQSAPFLQSFCLSCSLTFSTLFTPAVFVQFSSWMCILRNPSASVLLHPFLHTFLISLQPWQYFHTVIHLFIWTNFEFSASLIAFTSGYLEVVCSYHNAHALLPFFLALKDFGELSVISGCSSVQRSGCRTILYVLCISYTYQMCYSLQCLCAHAAQSRQPQAQGPSWASLVLARQIDSHLVMHCTNSLHLWTKLVAH